MQIESTDDASRKARLSELEPVAAISDVLAFYDSLPPVPVDALIGRWRGSGIDTGHPFDGLLERFGWYGKRFRSVEDVDPLVFRRKTGELFAINPSIVPLGLLYRYPELVRYPVAAMLFQMGSGLLATAKPQARLRMTEYRGVVSATMIYDSLPVNDVFRMVSSTVVLGVMDMRDSEQPFIFTLRKDEGEAD